MTETHAALVSGGMDSTVAADVAVRWGDADLLVYLDTGTGLRKNRRYVERLADWMGVQLWTLRTQESYIEQFREEGAPGSAIHGMMYRKLKERQIQRLAARVDELHCWTGVRRRESERRMTTVEPEGSAAGERWFWHAPIADWTEPDCRRYVRRYELPCSPLWDDLGRSGDCYCGCFASPEEKIDTLAAGCPGRVAWLDALEQQADHGDERDRWANGGLTRAEVRAERVDEGQMTLCSTCGVRAGGGRKREEAGGGGV
jgi:3'-phosphoadenosine 5'-phosphosulfate sulfotransferase (PAPS reductase)/FAD synthetase